jgi:hypothetical protein
VKIFERPPWLKFESGAERIANGKAQENAFEAFSSGQAFHGGFFGFQGTTPVRSTNAEDTRRNQCRNPELVM